MRIGLFTDSLLSYPLDQVLDAAQELVPDHMTLGDVDSPEALEDYQAKKRAHKAEMRARAGG